MKHLFDIVVEGAVIELIEDLSRMFHIFLRRYIRNFLEAFEDFDESLIVEN